MEFLCKLCKRTTTYNEELSFCPFCSSKYEKEFEAVGTSRRKELLELIPQLLELKVEKGIELTLKYGLPQKRVLEGCSLADRYKDLKKAESKKNLIEKLDAYLGYLKGDVDDIDNLNRIDKEEILDAQKFSKDKLDRVLEYDLDTTSDFFSLAGVRLNLGDFKLLDFTHQLKIESLSKDKLFLLYELILKEFEKFKAIVMDHPLLSIFGHSYEIGTMEEPFYDLIKKEGTSLIKTDELYELTRERLEKAQSRSYEFDFFDMDNIFLNHVKDFWIALECFGLLLSRDLVNVYKVNGEEIELDDRLAKDLKAYYEPALNEIEKVKVEIRNYPLEKLEGMLRGLKLSLVL